MNPFSAKLMRLKELNKLRPQYAEIYDFYTGLCKFLQSQEVNWFRCTPDMDSWDSRRQAGFPLLNRDALQIDNDSAKIFVTTLIARLIELGQEGQADLKKIAQAFNTAGAPVDKLLIACLENDREPLIKTATELDVPPALLEYVHSTALAYALQQWLIDTPQLSIKGWREGYCPICGGLPSMGELVGDEGQKKLHCSVCATSWEVTRLKCSCCGNEETTGMEYFTAEGEPGYRVDICRKCSCYLKVVDSRELGEGQPMDVEDLNTMHLDLLAQKEGFAKGKINQKK